MAEVEDAREAEDMVRSLYSPLVSFSEFETHKQGYTWIVTYKVVSVRDIERHEVHINARTGNMVTIR